MKNNAIISNKIKGSIFGGAIGDALGYPVEFMSARSIFAKYGTDGITEYTLDTNKKKALISDDTQMTLFTANGILVAQTRFSIRGIEESPSTHVAMSYQDWLKTQTGVYRTGLSTDFSQRNPKTSWLLDVPELYSRRAPGSTCMSSLIAQSHLNGQYEQNHSKGCGAVMRIAPLGLYYGWVEIETLMDEAIAISKITHGHSLACLPAAVLTYILNKIVYHNDDAISLKQIIEEAQKALSNHFRDDKYVDDLNRIIELSVRLSENGKSDTDNIAKIGEGWVGDEALGIAIYCSLKYQRDFSRGIIAAVNHSGDSDSTGAITGNILGAWNGYNRIENKWLRDLELFDVIDEIATDLCQDVPAEDTEAFEKWERKYACMNWKQKRNNESFTQHHIAKNTF